MSELVFPYGELEQRLPGPVELFICAASFENRCLTVARSLKSKPSRSYIIQNQENLGRVGANAENLYSALEPAVQVVNVSLSDPVLSYDAMATMVDGFNCDGGSYVLVDITCFMRETLLMFLSILRGKLSSWSNLGFVYNSARAYDVRAGAADMQEASDVVGTDPPSIWLSHGVQDVRTVLGYPGLLRPSRQTHLIILLGYEFLRAEEIIERVQPSKLSVGYGELDESTYTQHGIANLAFLKELKLLHHDLESFRIFPRSALKTRDSLIDVIDTFPNHNTVVAAMHTKISTCGAALAVWERPDVQICYAQAAMYNYEHYSAPGEDVYLFSLPATGSDSLGLG